MTGGRRALVFPGQGSQAVGMGRQCAREYSEAAAVFSEADHVLGCELSRLCWEGPEEELQLTANQQPAILTVSTAVARVLATKAVGFDVVAGHSLGEYSALVASGALDFGDAVRLVRRRGELMQEAVPPGVGAMAAVLGLDESAVRRVVEECSSPHSVCALANLNAPGQMVLAGHREAVATAVDRAKQAGARKAMMLAVSAPFHSPLMAPAREGMVPLLREVPLRDPTVPIVCNVDARPLSAAREIRDALVRQIDQPVRWIESVETMVHELGVASFVEVGPGRVLAGLIRRIAPAVTTASVCDPDSLQSLLAA